VPRPEWGQSDHGDDGCNDCYKYRGLAEGAMDVASIGTQFARCERLSSRGNVLRADVQLGLTLKDLARLFEQGLIELRPGRQEPLSTDDPLR